MATHHHDSRKEFIVVLKKTGSRTKECQHHHFTAMKNLSSSWKPCKPNLCRICLRLCMKCYNFVYFNLWSSYRKSFIIKLNNLPTALSPSLSQFKLLRALLTKLGIFPNLLKKTEESKMRVIRPSEAKSWPRLRWRMIIIYVGVTCRSVSNRGLSTSSYKCRLSLIIQRGSSPFPP